MCWRLIQSTFWSQNSTRWYVPTEVRVKSITDIEKPTNVTEVKSFLGACNFVRKHIAGYATIAEPLNELTRKGVDFKWEHPQQEVFDTLKKAVTSEPVLVFPDYEKPFHVFSDASQVGQGASLMQLGGADGKTYQVIAYVSRTLALSKRKWPAVQIELSAIISACGNSSRYLLIAGRDPLRPQALDFSTEEVSSK
uniref:Reverse transcriptase/retrotransposon-derived protein RNase H-like domain-containing protein n=1 Tax=Ditylenchus dipsaci TaxID=166011 RepID=A0A915ELH6_9BILA